MTAALTLAVVALTVATLMTPHEKLRAWWQASTAKYLSDRVREEYRKAQGQTPQQTLPAPARDGAN